MKFKYAKIIVVLTSIGFTLAGFAQNDATGASMPNNAGISGGYNPANSIHGWHISFGGFMSRFGNNDTAYVTSVTGRANTTTYDFHNIGSANQFGWNVGIGYYIDWKDSDINLNFYTINSSTDNHLPKGNYVPLPAYGTGTVANASEKFNYTALALTAGHTLRLSPFFDVYYYGGVNYNHFSQNIHTFVGGGTAHFNSQADVSFNGVGPTFGINGDCYPFFYNELPNFSVSGGVQTSLLYGNRNYGYWDKLNNLKEMLNYPSSNMVVPTVSGNIALNYLFQMNAWSLKTTLGYQDTVLFGVGTSASGLGIYEDEVNSSFQGVYLNFIVRF